jgi:hypothetical protein
MNTLGNGSWQAVRGSGISSKFSVKFDDQLIRHKGRSILRKEALDGRFFH